MSIRLTPPSVYKIINLINPPKILSTPKTTYLSLALRLEALAVFYVKTVLLLIAHSCGSEPPEREIV